MFICLLYNQKLYLRPSHRPDRNHHRLRWSGRKPRHMHSVHPKRGYPDLLCQRTECQSLRRQQQQQQDLLGRSRKQHQLLPRSYVDVGRLGGVIISNPTSVRFHVDVGTCKGSACGHRQSSSSSEYRFDHLFLPLSLLAEWLPADERGIDNSPLPLPDL